MKKILFVATVQSHIAQFHKPYIKMLKKMGYEVHVAAKDNLSEKNGLTLLEPNKIINVDFVRNPFSGKNIKYAKFMKNIIKEENYDLVICNTPIIGVYSRIICRKMRKNGLKVMYIAHGFHFFKHSSKKNWLLYFPIEFLLARLTDALVTINKEDYNLAKKYFKAKNVCYIPGIGVDTKKYMKATTNIDLRKEFNISKSNIILFSVGELYPRKNHQIIIEALAELQREDIYYIICGNGILEGKLKKLVKNYNLTNNVIFAGYRTDIPEILKAVDVFCFPSLREGLGLAGIEAMASGLPLITSNVNGINDYMINGKTGIQCDPFDKSAFASAIVYLSSDIELRRKIGEYNKIKSVEFDISNSLLSMRQIYELIGIIENKDI